MADILIRGMEMPRDGVYWCEISIASDIAIITIHGEDRKSFSLVPLPEGHGRLGDLDKLEENLRFMAEYQTGERQQGILGCCETIRGAKPIVPAEGGMEDV